MHRCSQHLSLPAQPGGLHATRGARQGLYAVRRTGRCHVPRVAAGPDTRLDAGALRRRRRARHRPMQGLRRGVHHHRHALRRHPVCVACRLPARAGKRGRDVAARGARHASCATARRTGRRRVLSRQRKRRGRFIGRMVCDLAGRGRPRQPRGPRRMTPAGTSRRPGRRVRPMEKAARILCASSRHREPPRPLHPAADACRLRARRDADGSRVRHESGKAIGSIGTGCSTCAISRWSSA